MDETNETGTATATRKPRTAKPAAKTEPLKLFNVCIPTDKMAPTLEVEAATAGDAKDVYCEKAGIRSTEHSIHAVEVIPADGTEDD